MTEENQIPKWPDPLSLSQMREVVLGIADHRIFTNHHIPVGQEDMVGHIFMPLMFDVLKEKTDEELNNIGALWEYYDKAGRLAINGFPVFTSVRFINMADWLKITEAYDKEVERRKNIVIE